MVSSIKLLNLVGVLFSTLTISLVIWLSALCYDNVSHVMTYDWLISRIFSRHISFLRLLF